MNLLELWSEKVKTKKHPKEGLFSKGSATEIVSWLKSEHEDLADAMSALNFYINRAGKNLSDTQKAKLAHAKALLKHAGHEKKKDKDEKEVKESILESESKSSNDPVKAYKRAAMSPAQRKAAEATSRRMKLSWME